MSTSQPGVRFSFWPGLGRDSAAAHSDRGCMAFKLWIRLGHWCCRVDEVMRLQADHIGNAPFDVKDGPDVLVTRKEAGRKWAVLVLGWKWKGTSAVFVRT